MHAEFHKVRLMAFAAVHRLNINLGVHYGSQDTATAMAAQWGDPGRLARLATQTAFQFA